MSNRKQTLENSKDLDNLEKRVDKFLENEDYSQIDLIKLIESAQLDLSGNWFLTHLLSLSYNQIGKYQHAIDIIEEMESIETQGHEKFVPLLYIIIDSYYELGSKEEVKDIVEAALKRDIFDFEGGLEYKAAFKLYHCYATDSKDLIDEIYVDLVDCEENDFTFSLNMNATFFEIEFMESEGFYTEAISRLRDMKAYIEECDIYVYNKKEYLDYCIERIAEIEQHLIKTK